MRPLHSSIKPSLYNAAASHCWAVKSGTFNLTQTANKIITGYLKCGKISHAHNLFDEMSHRDTVSWNAMIGGWVSSGNVSVCWDLFQSMRRCGFWVDEYTFASVLKGIACDGQVDAGEQIHGVVVKMGCEKDVFTGSSLLGMYVKCRKVDEAFVIFERMEERNSVSWNTLIAGCVEESDVVSSFDLFRGMQDEGVKLDDGTFAPLLTLLDDSRYYNLTMQMHGKIFKHGLTSNNIVCNALISSYSECGSLDNAGRVFKDAAEVHDIVSWNSMLGAYLEHQEIRLALELFLELQDSGFQPDIYTYTSLASGCFEEIHGSLGKCIHGLVITKGLESSTAICDSLIAMYVKSSSNSMENALRLFESLERKDTVSWNSVLAGFSQAGLSEDALKFFVHMRSTDVAIDHYSLSAALKSCSDLATLQLGQQIHSLAIKVGWQQNEHVTSSIIFMYSKCGLLEDARKSFQDAGKYSTIAWNTILFAYAQHGEGEVALELFHLMAEAMVKVDHITFVALLTACSHAGLVAEGHHFLKVMESDHGIRPRMEHYACCVDLFGRAGLLDEAKALIESMPFEPDTTLWITLLAACRNCGDVEFADQVARRLFELEPEKHTTYVILSDMYGRLKRWDEKADLTKRMRETGVKKVPGWSWIEVEHVVHGFMAEDVYHRSCGMIYNLLEVLMEHIRMLKSASDSDSSMFDLVS